MKKYYLSALAALTLASSAFAGNPDDYIGAIWPTAATFCPVDTVAADGTIYPAQQYQALYALYGNIYGGSASSKTFAVPDMRGKMPIGAGTLPGTSYTFQLGRNVGQETATLTQSTLPAHTHTATFTRGSRTNPVAVTVPASSNITGNTNQPSATNNYLAASSSGGNGANMWASTNTNPVNLAGITSSGGTGTGTVSVGTAGTPTPASITTIPPQVGIRFCIVTNGEFPVRPN